MSKPVKDLMIKEIRRRVGDCREVLVVNTSKLSGVATNKWRIGLQKKNIWVMGVKNAVARRALCDVGLSGLDKVMKGPSSIVWGAEDIVQLAREIVGNADVMKEIEITGGAIGATPLTPADVDSLSKSKGRLETLQELAGLILAPGARLAGALLGPGGKTAGCLKAMADKGGEEA